ncbi:MAG: type I restriction endonuclease subunit M [Gimesia sp.]|nr:type I restriction endonuclease subunit M [Gimesia sp.]
MPVEAKPLFRPDVLRPYIDQFQLPERVENLRPKLNDWAELISSGRADTIKETQLLPDFLTDFFYELLGYRGPAGGSDTYTISREQLVEVGGKFADAVLGHFHLSSERYIAALEGKGPKDPLERPFAGRKKSAVDQCYGYAINLPCDWIIVTSIRQTRLYYKGTDQHTYELFETESLARDDRLLRRFLFLLGAERMVPESGECHLYKLRAASEKVGKELTKEYYIRYADIRQDIFEQLVAANPKVSRQDLLACAQKLLDRVLFIAFCEDRGLLPEDSLKRAYEHKDPYHPRPVWENFLGLFRSVNLGNKDLEIPQYNGGLFSDDELLDSLTISDAVCYHFNDLGEFDYRPASQAALSDEDSGRQLIDVDILGHIFEQSISDLEKIRDAADGMTQKQSANERTRRRREGAFYTPPFITRYMVGETLGAVLADRFERVRQRLANQAKGTAVKSLEDPTVYDLEALNKPQREALIQFWENWQDELASIRILDPSCGSGAFLIEAFDQLHTTYLASNDRLFELRGQRTLFDLDRKILQDNLYGVDLNEEAIEICRLSLWIKTAARGKVLTSLDHTICVGNSIVADSKIDERAFQWQQAFPEVFENGGFDAVIGNPPYVRQELLSDIKPYLEQHFCSYHGMADLYTYFYELGMQVLRPGGRLSFIVTNKWMKSGYGEPLRKFFSEKAWMESVVDFGHAKQIFEQADVFPCIIVARKPTEVPAPESVRVCAIPREQLRINDLSKQIRTEGVEVERDRFQSESWSLEPKAVDDLMRKMELSTIPLREFTQVRPLSGIKTGYNEAFLIDTPTRDRLVAEDSRSTEIIKPYLRGQDINRWKAQWNDLWMITIKSSSDYKSEWSDKGDLAEKVFSYSYPSVYQHLLKYRDRLISRSDQGTFWWELRSCAYWNSFEKPKIIFPEITWRSQWCFDTEGLYTNNTVYFLQGNEYWLLAVANSPVNWWYSWRKAIHGKDEALRFIKKYVLKMPIPIPTSEVLLKSKELIDRLINISQKLNTTTNTILDWLCVEFEITKPNQKLRSLLDLNSDSLITEVRKVRGKKKLLSAAALKALREEYSTTIAPAKELALEALQLEHQLSDLVNQAYGLTPEEIDLMWKTAPPRMPLHRE